MPPAQLIEHALQDIQPLLSASGRAICIKQADETSCVIELRGFCGDCACTESYAQGISELIQQKLPHITNIQFERT